jgi:uncharacterized protein (TIGR02147 family)
MKIWDFTNYRDYLHFRLGSDGSRSGLRKKMASFIPVHTTFVSQVLGSKADFSLEQAESINQFLEHSEDEGDYFLLLVIKDRAGNSKLKKRYENKIQNMRAERLNIKGRLDRSEDISVKDREKFYSSSIYGAVHVLTSIESYQSIEALAEILKLSRKRVREIVEFLLKIQILVEKGDKIIPGPKHVHLSNDSELILKHHANWRQHTIAKLQFLNKDDLHYSASMSLSKADAFRIKESMLENLKQNLCIIEKSKEEEAYVMCLDFYSLTND